MVPNQFVEFISPIWSSFTTISCLESFKSVREGFGLVSLQQVLGFEAKRLQTVMQCYNP